MRIGSLFSGVGGLELGLEAAGVGEVVWQVEAEPFCREILSRHWPAAKRYSDIREVDFSKVEQVDLVCGGFPCQDISVAGKGEGLDGERSGLWSEFLRCICTVLPRWVVVENVSALRTRGMARMLPELAALGYDVVWDCLPASAIGAPHQRDRLFLVAWRLPHSEQISLRDKLGRRSGSSGNTSPFSKYLGEGLAHSHCTGRGKKRVSRNQGESGKQSKERNVDDRRNLPSWPPSPSDVLAWRSVPESAQPAFCRVADGLPPELDEFSKLRRNKSLRALGNAVVPQVAEIVGRFIVDHANA